MKRWHKLAALVMGVAVLAGVGATAGSLTQRRARPRRSRSASSTRGRARSQLYGARVHPGPATTGSSTQPKGTNDGQRPQGRAHARRRRDRPGQGRLGSEGPDRQGVQDHRRKRRRRASRSRSLRSPSRTRSSSSRARLRPTRSPGSTSTRSARAARPTRTSRPRPRTSSGGGRQERRRLRPGHLLSGRATVAAVAAGDRRTSAGRRWTACSCRSRRRTSRPFAQQLKQQKP